MGFLTIDKIVTAEKGWKRVRRKWGMRTDYCNLTKQQTLLSKPLLLKLMHWTAPTLQTTSPYGLLDSHLEMLLKYEYSQIFWHMPLLLMEIWLLLLQLDFRTFHSFSTCGFCRLTLTVEQVVTAGHNTSVRNFLKYDFSVKEGHFFYCGKCTV